MNPRNEVLIIHRKAIQLQDVYNHSSVPIFVAATYDSAERRADRRCLEGETGEDTDTAHRRSTSTVSKKRTRK